MPELAERLRDVVGVAHAGGVDDAWDPVEARLVEVGDREVERQLVQQLGQHLLVELRVHLAAAQRHLGDRAHARARRDPHAAQRRDHAAPRGLREVEARGLGREEVGDVAGDQRARRGHADEDRAAPGADRGGGLLAQRRVRLVADDDRVGVGDLARVADEPLVGLDGHRAVAGVLVAEQRRRDPLRVAAVAQLAVELVDQVAAVGQDQDAAGARRLDEAERGDRLARAGGVLEPEALGRVGILGLLVELGVVVVVGVGAPVERLLRLVLVRVLVVLLAGDADGRERDHVLGGDGAVAVAVALGLGEQGGQRARQRVDLVGAQHGAVDQPRLLLAEQPLEAEQQRELAPPRHRRHGDARVELGDRGVEGDAARAARRECGRDVLALGEEGLARELRGPLEVRGSGCVSGGIGHWRGFSQGKAKTFGKETDRRAQVRRPVKPSRARRRAGCRSGCAPSTVPPASDSH